MALSPDLLEGERGGLLRELAASPVGVLITCAGPSMEPALRRGDTVRVRRCDPRRLRTGEVFLFEASARVLELHRLVVALPGGWLVHRGDNQAVPGFGVTHAGRVIGRADLAARPTGPLELVRALAAAARRLPGAAWRRVRRLGALAGTRPRTRAARRRAMSPARSPDRGPRC